jgi:Tetratricopeptide repeat
VLGLDHTLTLDTVYNLGIVYEDQRRLAEAEVLFKRTLVGREKALGQDDASTLEAAHNLQLAQRRIEDPWDGPIG